MHMPGIDGIDLALRLRGRAETARLPLVLLSSIGTRSDHDAERLGEARFDAVLTKPVKPSAVVGALLTALAGTPIRIDRDGRDRGSSYDASLAKALPLRILLADDHPTNQKLALIVLERLGYRADVAGNGLEVPEALRRQPNDVVLMEIERPEMDGREAARHIREDWPPDERPVIVAVTANAMQGDRERFLAAGMDGHVSKPIRVETLVEALRLADQAEPEPSAALDGSALDALPDVVGGDREAPEMLVECLLDEGPKLAASLDAAAAAGDADRVRRAAHTLKSSASDFGITERAAICKALEAEAREGSFDRAAAAVGAGPRCGAGRGAPPDGDRAGPHPDRRRQPHAAPQARHRRGQPRP